MTLMINEIIAIIVFYVAFFPIGFVFLSNILNDDIKRLPFFLILGLSLIFGLATYVIILSILAYLLLSVELFFIIATISWSGFLVFTRKKKISFGNFDKLPNLTILIILVMSTSYVTYYLMNTPWHAADDAAFYGFTTSLLRHNDRNTMTHLPYADIPSTMGRGVPIIAAYIADIGGIQNGKAIMVAGALAIILMPILFYAIMFSLTKINSLSILAAVSIFNVYSTPYGMSIWSRFFTGNYGSVFGLLFLYSYVLVLVNFGFSQRADIRFYLSTTIFFLVASYFVYVGYLLHMLMFTCILFFAKFFKDRGCAFSFDFTKALMALVALVICVSMIMLWPNLFPREIVYFLWPILGRFSSERIDLLPESVNNPGYALDLSYFGQNLESLLLVFVMIIAIVDVIRKKRLRNLFTYFYIFLSLIVIFYSATGLRTMLYFAPKRTALATNHLVWLMLLLLLYHYLKEFMLPATKVKANTSRNSLYAHALNKSQLHNSGILFLAILVIIPCLLPHITYSYPRSNSWYVNAPYFESNFNAAVWLYEHATPVDLILNDMSFTGYTLLSMGVFNVTYANPITYFPSYRERAEELWQVWTNPFDEVLIINLLSEHNVTYVLSDADWKVLAIPGIEPITENGWLPKLYKPSVIASTFDSYPFLEKVFQQDDARVYRVLKDKLEDVMVLDTSIVDDRQEDFWNSSCWGTGTIGAPILSSNTEIIKHGIDSLKVEIPSGNCKRASISHVFDPVQDWSNAKYVILYLYGRNTSQVIDLLIIDSTDKAQRWEIKDDFLGWRQLIIPLNSDLGWTDWGEPGFTQLSDVQRIELRFTPNVGDVWFLDHIKVREILLKSTEQN